MSTCSRRAHGPISLANPLPAHRPIGRRAVGLCAVGISAIGLFTVGLGASAHAETARPVEWGYSGRLGPAHWAALSPAYSACGEAEKQSPIDLDPEEMSAVAPVRMAYRPTGLALAHHEHVTDILDNGHTLQVTVDEGSRLETPRDAYALAQFHFHAPAEHTIDGVRHPLEVHFVHQSASGRFAVVAGFYAGGPSDPNLKRLIDHLPAVPGESVHRPAVTLDPAAHLPSDLAAWSYAGSFTTPPCTEDVEWLVLRTPLRASAAQLEAFASRLRGNARPTQPRGARSLSIHPISERSTR